MKILAQALSQIHDHVLDGYPNEVCGLLLGTRGVVTEVAPAGNQRIDSPGDRYLIAPSDYTRIERDADRRGLQVFGIFHSHPEANAQPSQFDLDQAWPELAYLIIAVRSKTIAESLCWRLQETPRRFEPETLDVGNR
jgi:proteasome lid subunit RPN8/RPN11